MCAIRTKKIVFQWFKSFETPIIGYVTHPKFHHVEYQVPCHSHHNKQYAQYIHLCIEAISVLFAYVIGHRNSNCMPKIQQWTLWNAMRLPRSFGEQQFAAIQLFVLIYGPAFEAHENFNREFRMRLGLLLSVCQNTRTLQCTERDVECAFICLRCSSTKVIRCAVLYEIGRIITNKEVNSNAETE